MDGTRSAFRLATLERFESDLSFVEDAIRAIDERDLDCAAAFIQRIVGAEPSVDAFPNDA